MSSELDQLRRQLEEEKQLRQEERRLRQEEKRLREEEKRLREEEQCRRIAAEEHAISEQRRREEEQQYYQQRTGSTSLAEFLDAYHVHLYQGLTVQDKDQSTQGTPANADRKLRPDYIVPWIDFPAHQTRMWDIVMESDFISERHFTSLHTLKETGEQLHQRQLSSELDLQYFVRFAINDQVTSIIKHLSQHTVLRQTLNLQGSVKFENHGNMLSPDEAVQNFQNLTISQPQPRGRPEQSSSATRSSSPSRLRTSIPRADQFCVYSVFDEVGETIYRVPVLIFEYKAAHKLTLGHIYAGLRETCLDDIVQEQPEEDVERRCQRLVAAVVTQAFAYMISSRLEFGCVFTGEAFIFLRIPEDDYSRVHYALAVPHGDVGPTTGWTGELNHGNRLHLTAVSQLLAFTLGAIQSPRRTLQWRRNAEIELKTWQVMTEDLEEEIPAKDVPGSEYRPPQGDAARFLVESPICHRLRPRKLQMNEDAPIPTNPSAESDEDSDDGPASTETPSRAPPVARRGVAGEGTGRGGAVSRGSPSTTSYQQRNLGPYCSALCLKGLVEKGVLDFSCPNVHQHGSGPRHAIGLQEFRQLVQHVLQHQLEYCEELFLYGARGCLYRIRVPHWGYTMVAKGTRREFVADLQREASIYKRYLKPIQGIYTPVYLGSFDLAYPLDYIGVVPIVHIMVLSFGGCSLNNLRSLPAATDTAIEGLRAIHGLGILHRDVARRNMLWDSKEQRVIWHDFGRACICRRDPLTEKSVNTRTISLVGKKDRNDPQREFSKEIRKALSELRLNRSLQPGPLYSSVSRGIGMEILV
ncbi:uncharacterized protein Z518_11120 [Rhinocladiella mackenziei CBS 650.93]|uniref:Protein kinase domain-containing protein n=1 Tax=Rhinocladiella mackenziei CBS 650.93 TaxID=1442369 RepID=A0A0D2GMX0_9EURO|nr:uncharacterized protein Z518_11120 [Rhinocladiella mackenziei CBS 650.93]KIW99707.1 hypothetical protein Z518_11120 [Rhinocladiella mackenziei CBS 650.93]